MNYCRITTDKAEAKHAVKEVVQEARRAVYKLAFAGGDTRIVEAGMVRSTQPPQDETQSLLNSPEYVNERTNVHLSEEEKYAARSTADRESWAKSTVRVLIEEALSELIVLSVGSNKILPTGLRVSPCNGYKSVWSDKSIAVWRPNVPHGYFFLGDVAQDFSSGTPEQPSALAVTVRDDSDSILRTSSSHS